MWINIEVHENECIYVYDAFRAPQNCLAVFMLAEKLQSASDILDSLQKLGHIVWHMERYMVDDPRHDCNNVKAE